MPQIHIHVSALVERGGKYLLVRETKPITKDRWNLPGGHLEHDETPEQGAIRELKEETGLDGTLLHLIGIYHRSLREYSSIRFVFLVKAQKGDPYPGDLISEVSWQTKEEILAAPDTGLVSPSTLKQAIRDHTEAKNYPLELIRRML